AWEPSGSLLRVRELVDLVGIEPTTSSMPCRENRSRGLVFKQLATGTSGRKRQIRRCFRPISGQEFQHATAAELHGRGFSSCREFKTQDGTTRQKNQSSA